MKRIIKTSSYIEMRRHGHQICMQRDLSGYYILACNKFGKIIYMAIYNYEKIEGDHFEYMGLLK